MLKSVQVRFLLGTPNGLIVYGIGYWFLIPATTVRFRLGLPNFIWPYLSWVGKRPFKPLKSVRVTLRLPNLMPYKLKTDRAIFDARRQYQKKEYISNWLLTHPCADCGITDVRVLQFDHVRGEKIFCVTAYGSHSLDKLVEEIDKCEVRCANCHCIRHRSFNGAFGVKVSTAACEAAGESSNLSLHPNWMVAETVAGQVC